MKIIKYFFLLFIAFASCKGRQNVCDCLIGEKLESEIEFEQKSSEKLNFVIIDSYEYDINNDGVNENIILEKLQFDWEEPGDFHRIRIIANDTCFSFFNSGGWIKLEPSLIEYIPDFFLNNILSSDYIAIDKHTNDLLLFAFGYVYASEPGLLSIINLSQKTPKLILNENYLLSGYQKDNPQLTVTKYFKESNLNRQDTLLLNNHCFTLLNR